MFEYICTIIKVVDGDTVTVDIDLGFNIVLKNQEIRLLGIDTPESRTSNEQEKKQGLLSKQKLKEKLPEGTKQRIKTEKDELDKYGRVLGVFPLENSSVNQWLIDNNYAVPYNGENKDKIVELHLLNRQILINRGEI